MARFAVVLENGHTAKDHFADTASGLVFVVSGHVVLQGAFVEKGFFAQGTNGLSHVHLAVTGVRAHV